MKQLKFVFLFLLIQSSLIAQDIPPAPEGKSVVYFMRPSGMGFAINFTYYDGDQLIAKFKGGKYFRYVCEPGEHVFWARSENKSYVKTNLASGKIYIIEASPTMGGFKTGVRLNPVDPNTSKRLPKYQKQLAKKESEIFSEEELQKLREEMKEVTTRGMEKLQELEAEGFAFAFLTSDMFVDLDKLKRK